MSERGDRPDGDEPHGAGPGAEGPGDLPPARGAASPPAESDADERAGEAAVEEAARETNRTGLIAAAITLGVVVLGSVGWLMLGGGDGGRSSASGPTVYDPVTTPCVDGIVMAVDEEQLVLMPSRDRASDRTFVIREEVLPRLDIPHIRNHAAVSQPTRVFYRSEGDTQYLLAAEDAPLTTGEGNEGQQCSDEG